MRGARPSAWVMLALAAVSLAAPSYKSGGHALSFQATRNDVAAVDLGDATRGMIEDLEITDVVQTTHTPLAYAELALEAADDSVRDAPDALQVRLRDDRACFYRSGVCDRTDFQLTHEWVHLAYAWDVADGSVRAYKNGALVAPFSNNESAFREELLNGGCFLLGHEMDAFCGGFDEDQALSGVIDELRVWSVVRSDEEIARDFSRGYDGLSSRAGLIASWDFDDDDDPYASRIGNARVIPGALPSLSQIMVYNTPRGSVRPTNPLRVFVAADSGIAVSPPARSSVPCWAGVSFKVSIGFSGNFNIAAFPKTGRLVDAMGGAITSSVSQVYYVGPCDETFSVSQSGSTVKIALSSPLHVQPPRRVIELRATEHSTTLLKLFSIDVDSRRLGIRVVRVHGAIARRVVNVAHNYEAYTIGAEVSPDEDVPSGLLALSVGEYNASSGVVIIEYLALRSNAVSATSGTVRVTVTPVNNPPEPVRRTVVSVDAKHAATITLGFNLGDASTVDRFQIVSWPVRTTLYTSQGAIPTAESPLLLQYGKSVISATSQYTRCEPCWSYAVCPNDCPDGSADYHASQLLGPPDVHPSYGDDPRAWAPRRADSEDVLRIALDRPVFMSSVSLYETYFPGSIVEIASESAATTQILWSGAPERGLPQRSRVFSPLLCAPDFPASTLKVSLNAVGWSEIDAVMVLGSETRRRGSFSSPKVVARVAPGVYGDVIDSFSYKAADCAGISETEGVVTLSRPLAPGFAETALSADESYIEIITSLTTDTIHTLRFPPTDSDDEAIFGVAFSPSQHKRLNIRLLEDGKHFEIEVKPNEGRVEVSWWRVEGNLTFGMLSTYVPQCDIGSHATPPFDICVRCDEIVDLTALSTTSKTELEDQCIERFRVPDSSRNAVLVLTIMGVLFSVAMLIFVKVYSAHPVIKLSSVYFLKLVLLGTIFAFAAVLCMSAGTMSTQSCSGTMWLLAAAFSFVFIPLILKTYRIFKIFENRSMKLVQLKDADLLRYLGSFVVVVAIYFLFWTFIPTRSVRWTRVTTFKYQQSCVYDASWDIFPVCVATLIVIFGLILIFRARKVPSAVNETLYLGFIFYLVCCIGAVFLPIAYSSSDPLTRYWLTALTVLFGTYSLILILMLPKVLAVYVDDEAAWTVVFGPPESQTSHNFGRTGKINTSASAGSSKRLRAGNTSSGSLSSRAKQLLKRISGGTREPPPPVAVDENGSTIEEGDELEEATADMRTTNASATLAGNRGSSARGIAWSDERQRTGESNKTSDKTTAGELTQV